MPTLVALSEVTEYTFTIGCNPMLNSNTVFFPSSQENME